MYLKKKKNVDEQIFESKKHSVLYMIIVIIYYLLDPK